MKWRSRQTVPPVPAVPRTNAGKWLRAMYLGQWELRDSLRSTLNNGQKKGWNDDEPALVEAVCELSVRQYFGPDYDVRAVTDFVELLRAATKDNNPFPQLESEAVIRAALGEADIDLSGISRFALLGIRTLAGSLATDRMRFGEAEVDQLISEAEQITFERGWHPPLAE
jgi:hypothetical protein